MTIYPLYRGRAPFRASWLEFSVIVFSLWLIQESTAAKAAALDERVTWLAFAIWLLPVLVIEPLARIGPPPLKSFALGCSFGFLAMGGMLDSASLYHVALAMAVVSLYCAPLSGIWIFSAICWLPAIEPLWQFVATDGLGVPPLRGLTAAAAALWALREAGTTAVPPARERTISPPGAYAT